MASVIDNNNNKTFTPKELEEFREFFAEYLHKAAANNEEPSTAGLIEAMSKRMVHMVKDLAKQASLIKHAAMEGHSTCLAAAKANDASGDVTLTKAVKFRTTLGDILGSDTYIFRAWAAIAVHRKGNPTNPLSATKVKVNRHPKFGITNAYPDYDVEGVEWKDFAAEELAAIGGYVPVYGFIVRIVQTAYGLWKYYGTLENLPTDVDLFVQAKEGLKLRAAEESEDPAKQTFVDGYDPVKISGYFTDPKWKACLWKAVEYLEGPGKMMFIEWKYSPKEAEELSEHVHAAWPKASASE